MKKPVRHACKLRLLSNGSYSVMLCESGSGYSRWRDLAVTRWREDPTRDPWGSYLLLHDDRRGVTWSPTGQPYGRAAPDDSAEFSPGRITFNRTRDGVHARLEVAVAADADIELRRLTLTNHGRARTITVTSYAELVIGPAGADSTHPAFSKMFVQTLWDPTHRVLLATRRQRANGDAGVWSAHALQILGESTRTAGEHGAATEYETDRARFIGRGRTLRNAAAMQPGAALSDTCGCVLDPIVSLRRRVTLGAGATAEVLLWTRVGDSRKSAQALQRQLGDPRAAEKILAGAARFAQSELARLGIDSARERRFANRLGGLLISDSDQRPGAALLAEGAGGPATLWPAGISGDRPIILLHLARTSNLATVRDALLAQNYWRGQGLGVDVVLLNDAADGAALQAALEPLIATQQARLKADEASVKAELFALRAESISDELRRGLLTAARVVVDGAKPAAAAQSALARSAAPAMTTASPAIRACTPVTHMAAKASAALEFANGIGGFSNAGREYQIDLDHAMTTPAPWVNVIANPNFGCLISAEGGGYTWSLNSQQNPITPWPNDPVSDTPYEVLYLRDEDSGALWSATALPIRVADATYRTTHGKGWSRLTNDAHGIDSELTLCVPSNDSIKLSRLRLCNRSGRARHLSITAYVEWALGGNGTVPAPFVITSRDSRTGALLARNPWRGNFGQRVAFMDLAGHQQSMSGDRREFLGSFGAVDNPAALGRNAPLSANLGAGLDPCGALQTRVELPPGMQIDVVFMLGDADSENAARALIEKYRATDVETMRLEAAARWNEVLDAVQVRTPDRAMDIMLNDWLLYQVVGCRLWARTAYYQASGAYGFRDQLQDVMALCITRPDLAREHLLRAAGRQFAQGDVQHWWLPPGGQGVRTHISDARIWLAYVAVHYVTVTGDAAVLDEVTPFLKGPDIAKGAHDVFFQPETSDKNASVYEHAALAIDSSLTRGAHGLPLIGTGDWNDGMNAVGEKGRGESTWLGWFLLSTIAALTPHATQRGEVARAKRWNDYGLQLRQALQQAWDGAWYRRGYFDDGAPLGSHESEECRIDTIAQSWSVLANSTQTARTQQAMNSVDRLLVDHPHRIARLFTPPFDRGRENPGYIKGYPPGVRENGGQYTHGATWSIFAWAGLGDGDRAGALFDLLNPIYHGNDATGAQRYKVEPYVVAADVYSVAPHLGRGGWTWYTGSSAWLYRAGIEALLGFQLRGKRLRLTPCIPKAWPGFAITYRRRREQATTLYEISVENPRHVCRGVTLAELDGRSLPATDSIALVDDGKTHVLRIVLG